MAPTRVWMGQPAEKNPTKELWLGFFVGEIASTAVRVRKRARDGTATGLWLENRARNGTATGLWLAKSEEKGATTALWEAKSPADRLSRSGTCRAAHACRGLAHRCGALHLAGVSADRATDTLRAGALAATTALTEATCLASAALDAAKGSVEAPGGAAVAAGGDAFER